MENRSFNQDVIDPAFSDSRVAPTVACGERTPAYQNLPVGELEAAIEKISPDGRPAHPEVGPKKIRYLMLVLAGVLLIAGALVAIFVNIAMGLIGIFLSLLGFVTNPEFLATIFRSKERHDAEEVVDRDEAQRMREDASEIPTRGIGVVSDRRKESPGQSGA